MVGLLDQVILHHLHPLKDMLEETILHLQILAAVVEALGVQELQEQHLQVE
tara:strand:+ start:94 stop:246 length:153 start_codon:yes stop_codon:yes gene_type:complete